MEILLNEKSLNGQFHNLDEFCDTLPEMSINLKILDEMCVTILKHSSLYECKITEDLTIRDLQNNKGMVLPQDRDKVRRWKSLLFSVTNAPPFWDVLEQSIESAAECTWRGNDVSHTSLGEAARRNVNVLSFRHALFSDTRLEVLLSGIRKDIVSFVSTKYLTEFYYNMGIMNIVSYLHRRYSSGRINAQQIDTVKGSVEDLQKAEIPELLEALKRFEEMESWNEIVHDRFFNYKKYQPSSKEVDWFAHSEYSNKQIDKFRCGEHSRIRCFGYREGEQFVLLRVERDHSISDNG